MKKKISFYKKFLSINILLKWAKIIYHIYFIRKYENYLLVNKLTNNNWKI